MSKNIIGYRSQEEKIKRLTERIEKLNEKLKKKNSKLQNCFDEISLRKKKIEGQRKVLKLCHDFISQSPIFHEVEDEVENQIIQD